MNTLLKFIFILSFFFCTTTVVMGQAIQDTTIRTEAVIVKMKNGDEFKGVIIKKDQSTITLKTANGELNLIAANVVSIARETYTGKFKFANTHDTRYFFGPSGIPIKHKNGYYQNVLVTTNFFNYGITKNISVGGGFEFISTVLGKPIWFLTPKMGFDLSNKLHVAGGVIVAGFASEGSASLGYGVFTLGTNESNISVGAGYGFFSGEFSKYPAIMLSGTHRLSNSIALLSENYIIPNTSNDAGYFGIQGIRILSPKNAFDIGALIIPAITEFIPALPFVGYARSF